MKLYKTKKSKIDNFGLYATKDIKKGTKIIEYKGKVITRKEAEENHKYDNDKAIYLFNLLFYLACLNLFKFWQIIISLNYYRIMIYLCLWLKS